MGRTFVIGDIHGAYRALRQCLDKASFDYDQDHLICLGDVADGWPETKACVEELLSIKKLTYILGNHDFWTRQWMQTGLTEELWLNQGGDATVGSYAGKIPEHHIKFFKDALPFYKVGNSLFVHAGINPRLKLQDQDLNIFLWDRNLARTAFDLHAKGLDVKLTAFDEIYLGHTPIPYAHPIKCCEVWLMDTGAGWQGVLSIMNTETKEFFTSDPVGSLYPGVMGRHRK